MMQTVYSPVIIRQNDFYLDRAARLLAKDERLPQEVKMLLAFCYHRNVPIILSRNAHAGSCEDAASKRLRSNGSIGIPLFMELKSLIISYKGKHTAGIAGIHAPADLPFSFKQIKRLLREKNGEKISISLLDPQTLKQLFDMSFGTVNPILLEVFSKGQVLQIFDNSLLTTSSRTMMTNAGNHTWGIEFKPACLMQAIENRLIAPIIQKAETDELSGEASKE